MSSNDGAIVLTNADGSEEVLYKPQPKQALYHASSLPNLIMEGRRGTGKSLAIRWDFHMRALAHPGFTYLILRRTTPELRKSHLLFIGREMEKLGGTFLKTTSEAHYANGSVGVFGNCETDEDVNKYLSAQFAGIAFDEITTFPFDMITRISSSCRVEKGSGLLAVIRGGTNPLGVSADDVYRYFIGKDVTPEEDPEYVAEEWGSIRLTRDDNAYIDHAQYDRRLAGLPEAYRKAWLEGEWGVEGAYFAIEPKHTITEMPVISTLEGARPADRWPWMHVYRLLDFGWHDPTVCVWVLVLPDGREIAFKEMSWIRTPVQTVARDILKASAGMRVVTTIADPTLWAGEKEMGHSIADEFESGDVPLTRGKNDRTAAGFAIQEHLNSVLDDGLPKLQIYEPGCPTLVKALRAMRVDKKAPGRISDHRMDHMPICLGYFCMAGVGPTHPPAHAAVHTWMQPKRSIRVLGSGGVRS